MAVITTNFAPGAEFLGYGDLGDRARLVSASPYGEVRYRVTGGQQVPATGAGDNKKAVVTCNIPEGSAFWVQDVYPKIAPSAGETWSNGLMTINDGTIQSFSALEAVDVLDALVSGVQVVYGRVSGTPFPVGLYVPAQGVQATVQFTFDQPVANTGASFISVFVRVMLYGLQQAYASAVNTPLPVRR